MTRNRFYRGLCCCVVAGVLVFVTSGIAVAQPGKRNVATPGNPTDSALSIDLGRSSTNPPYSSGSQSPGESPAVSGLWVAPQRAPWTGEVFKLGMRWQLDWPRFNFIDGQLQTPKTTLVTSAWSKPLTEVPEPGSTTGLVSTETQAMALTPGTLTIDPAKQQFSLFLNSHDNTGAPKRARSELIESADLLLEVVALPAAPVHFSGAVGQFELTVSVSEVEIPEGQILAWTVILHGTGNWPMRPALPARILPKAFTVVDAPELKQVPGTSVFDGRLEETILLTPTRAGSYELPEVSVVVFEPDLGQYVTLAKPAISIVVTPLSGSGSAQEELSEPLSEPIWEPMTGDGMAWIPLKDKLWYILMLLPIVGVLLYWFILSLMHAWASDPLRQQRRAHFRLRRLLKTHHKNSDVAHLRRWLIFWQRTAAQRFGITSATPVSADMAVFSGWSELWREADAVLYGGASSLPSDWLKRASNLLENTPVPPRFNPARALSRRHLLLRPYVTATLLCLCVVLIPMPASGMDSTQSISGQDWIASYNHAVRLLEEEQPNKAAAFASAAWLRSPADKSAYELWISAAQNANFGTHAVPQPMTPFYSSLLGVSPALWRWVAVAAMILLGLAIGIALGKRYGRSNLPFGFIVALGLVGGFGLLVSTASLECYGFAASPDAVVIWQETMSRPLPIEQPDDDQMAVIPAGTLARADKALLGWLLLKLDSGKKVWVRKEDIVWLWRDNSIVYQNLPDYIKQISPTHEESF